MVIEAAIIFQKANSTKNLILLFYFFFLDKVLTTVAHDLVALLDNVFKLMKLDTKAPIVVLNTSNGCQCVVRSLLNISDTRNCKTLCSTREKRSLVTRN